MGVQNNGIHSIHVAACRDHGGFMKSCILSVKVLRVLVYCSACYKAMPHTSSPVSNRTKTLFGHPTMAQT